MQQGVVDAASARRLEEQGIGVAMDRCILVEHERLGNSPEIEECRPLRRRFLLVPSRDLIRRKTLHMERTTKRALSFSALIAAAVVFGMVVAGSVNVTPRSEAQREPAPAAAPARRIGRPPVLRRHGAGGHALGRLDHLDGHRQGKPRPPLPAESLRRKGDPFEFFFGPPGGQNRRGQPRDEEEHKEVQGGTGFIISEDGYVVTNNHVIDGADKIEVRINNKEKYAAKLIGKDAATDLALLKIDVKQRLTPLPLGDSDKLRVGEWVMAIGDPLNFDKTVTVGVVSAKDRSGLTADAATRSFENYIQTDAAINFGNSGGPLLNTNGEVIGINTAIFRPAQNIGFAVPINTLKTDPAAAAREGEGHPRLPRDQHRQRRLRPRRRLRPEGPGGRVRRVRRGRQARREGGGPARRHDRPGRQRAGQGHARPDRLRLRQGSGQQGAARRSSATARSRR